MKRLEPQQMLGLRVMGKKGLDAYVVKTYNDDGDVIDSVELCPEDGSYGVNILKGVWHKVESLESGSVFFECKEGPFVPHEVDGILEVPEK